MLLISWGKRDDLIPERHVLEIQLQKWLVRNHIIQFGFIYIRTRCILIIFLIVKYFLDDRHISYSK